MAQSCYHCGLPVPAGADFSVTIEGEPRAMCCPGCQAVAGAIVAGGLENFYRYRTENNVRPEPTDEQWQIYDLPEVQSEFVLELEPDLSRASLLLEGITCAACSWLIEQQMARFASVKSLSVDVTSHRCNLNWNPKEQPLSELMAALAAIGYRPRPATDTEQRQAAQRDNRLALMRLGVAGFGMMQAGMVSVGLYTGAADEWQLFLRWLSFLLTTPVVLFSARPFFQTAWRSLRAGQLVMDVPVALAIGLAYTASAWATITDGGEVYFDSVAMFTFFLLVGRYLEMRSRHRNRLAYGNLAQLLPLSAHRLEPEGERSVPVTSLRLGDRVRVRSGETFPCDGRVVSGQSEVVEALLTGESQPQPKGPDDLVVGGTLNSASALELEVTAVGADTQVSAVERLVARAERDKPRQQALADQVARYFVGAVLLIFVLVFAAWYIQAPERAFWVAISVLVVTCPCALALAMPTALTAATAQLRRQGLLIARGHVLETLTRVDRVLFDKTGTLTQGRFSLEEVQMLETGEGETLDRDTLDRDTLLAIAAALEAPARHPIADAFAPWRGRKRAQQTRQATAQGVEGLVGGRWYRLGRPDFAAGLYHNSQTDSNSQTVAPQTPDKEGFWLLLAGQQGPLAWLRLEDRPRPGAAELVAFLKKRGIAVELLSGDPSGAVARLASELGIDEYTAGALPEQKLARLQAHQAQGERVLMLGDGINDVPVLAAADLSVAMASASDLAQTRADALLLNENLLALARAFELAGQTRTVIKQNLGLSLGYNLSALPLAALGFVPPWLAAIGMTSSSLVVILNALRLQRHREGD